jgi:acyl carrier protein
MIERQEITDRIRSYLLREVLAGAPASELSDDSPLIGGGILDSVAMIRLVVFLEDEFSISIDGKEVGPSQFDTVGKIADLVASKTADR